MADELNDRQKRFVKEYIKDFNATQAAIRAGYSEESARQIGSEILAKPYIQEAVQREIEKRNKRVEVSQDRIVEELAKIAYADLKDFIEYDAEGKVRLKPYDQIDGAVLQEISETQNSRGSTRKVKLHDKMKALELLGKHLGIYKDVVLTNKEPVKLTLDEIEKLESEDKSQ